MFDLYNENCLIKLNDFEKNSIDMILSDIPYGISYENWDILHANSNSALGGNSEAQLKSGNIFKKRGKPLNGWSNADKNISNEYYNWCKIWSDKCFNILKPGASVFIFAGRRMAHKCISALEDSGFIFKDMIAWEKSSAFYKAQHVSSVFNRRNDVENSNIWSGWRLGNLRPIFEPILWFIKPYKIGTTLVDNILKYGLGGFNDEYWKQYNPLSSNIIKIKSTKNDKGKHPTQKPLELIKLLIQLVTTENQIVLDPFMGSGTTGVACKNTNRNFIGIEKDKNYFDIAKIRIENE